METEDKFLAVLFLLGRHTEYAAAKKPFAARNMQRHGKDKGGSPMRKIKEVFALLAAALTLTTAALAAEPGDVLVPVGEAVAISLRCDGVVVSALADIASENGTCCPAGEAGVQAGDKIVAVNGERVTNAEDFLRRAADFSGECVTLSVERGGEAKTFAVTPRLGSGGTYQIGLWLRDAVRGNVRACECCLDAAKTVEGAYDAMKREAARKKDGGNCVVIAPDEAFGIIAKYYGFDAAEAAESAKSTESQAIANPGGDVESLFDLL